MKRGALFLLLALACTAAAAADWTRLTQIRGEDQYFYDGSKLVIDGEEITYWKKVVFKRPQPMKNQFAAWSLMRERINCSQHTLRLISYLYYAADGSVIDYVPDHEKEGTPIIPDTLGDAFERQMCALVKAKQAAEKPAPSAPAAPDTASEPPTTAPESAPESAPAPATPPEPAVAPR